MVQNKKDLTEGKQQLYLGKPQLKFQEEGHIDQLCSVHGFVKWYQISIKDDNVDHIFEELVDQIITRKLIKLDADNSR